MPNMKLPYRRKMYTTGEVADMIEVTRPTVRHWCDSGLLKCHLIAGTSHRRIRHRDLVSFFRAHNMSALIDLIATPAKTVLLVGCNPQLPGQLAQALGEGWNVRAVGNHFEAGEAVARVVPGYGVLDLADREESTKLALQLAHHSGMFLVGLTYEGQPIQFKEERQPFQHLIPHWSTPKTIAARIRAGQA